MFITDLFFPKTCIGCGRVGMYICAVCIHKISHTPVVCPYCKKPSIDGTTHACCRRKFGIDGLSSVWKYEGVVKKGISALKYKYATKVGEELTGYLIDELPKFIFPSVNCLVPVPVFWHKQNTRGFNQSIELGGKIAENLRLKFIPDLLVKKIPTVPQATLSGKARRRNLQGSFVLRSHNSLYVPDSVLLFDDVFTTGSTLFEAAKVLKKGGVNKVWGLTIAG